MPLKSIKVKVKYSLLDIADYFYRIATNQRYLPPRSLRNFVGGAKGFAEVGPWFLNDFKKLGLINNATKKILDIGCGSGRLAYALSKDHELNEQGINYMGMDIDDNCIKWCKKNIQKHNPRFEFFEVDLFSKEYNPKGKQKDFEYKFPFEDHSFDLIILTSVFTHMLEPGIANYCKEISRLLTDKGTAYASVFIYETKEEAIKGVPRRVNKFPFYYENYALVNLKTPEAAVAYQEDYLIKIFEKTGLSFRMPPRYGLQDLYFLKKN